jgi:hypothetical protein
MSSYKVFFYAGEELGLKTKVEKGTALLSDSEFRVQGVGSLSIPVASITSTNLFRLHGLGRVIQIDHSQGRMFVSVVRFMIGQLAFINFFKTGELHNQLTDAIYREQAR